MKTYQPQISVIVTKARNRTEIAPGMPVDGTRYSQLPTIDLTPYLGDGSHVSVVKGTRQPSSGFSLRFADQPHELMSSVGTMLEPMDLIEIRIGEPQEKINGKLPLLLRGFIGDISCTETMDGGKPMRFVSVSGHCLAKAMQVFRICYLPFTKEHQFAFSDRFKFFYAYSASGNIKFMSGAEFADLTVQHILNPFLQGFKGLANLECTDIGAANTFQSKSTIEGSISPYQLSSFTDVSLTELMSTTMDIGVFNEMFLEQTEAANTLVIRPIPFLDVYGKTIQGDIQFVDIHSNDILHQTALRTDQDTANWFWVDNNRAAMLSDVSLFQRASEGDPSSFVKLDHFNSAADTFGIRKLQVESSMSGNDMLTDDGALEAEVNKGAQSIVTWSENRRSLLGLVNADNAVWESGTLKIRGQSAAVLKPGVFINVFRGVTQSLNMTAYAHSVVYEYIFGQGFFCTITYDRSTGFIVRAQDKQAPYLKSIESGIF